MSRQSKAREKQGYAPKAVPLVCANCIHFDSVRTAVTSFFGDPYVSESLLRCALGDFSVKKMGTCNEWAGEGQQ